ncbi:glycosyltransferase family protein (DUF23) [Tasmannia lanceolata]|uniref:glycosyltransferase family protein (DUF23) n=1 Tax=Tasmannia lanceolata TaxID=3420 RepID=UPI004063E921
MEFEQRKRKHAVRPKQIVRSIGFARFCSNHMWVRIICYCCVSFIVFFILFLLSSHKLFKDNFRPILILPRLSSARSWVKGEIDSTTNFVVRVEDRVIFPDHILLLLSNKPSLSLIHQRGELKCIYHETPKPNLKSKQIQILSVYSVDFYKSHTIARCPLPPTNFSATVTLKQQTNGLLHQAQEEGEKGLDLPVHTWETMVYEAFIDGKTVVVLAKGLNLRPARVSNPTQITCHFGWAFNNTKRFSLKTKALTAAQEVFRCPLPLSLQKNPTKANGLRITLSISPISLLLPSVAKIFNPQKEKNKQSEMCVCTMVRNQALSLREWIIYHGNLGVQRWFIYDNNSEDPINETIIELQNEGYKITRHVWPWIKTQEAGFSHCAMKAKDQCKWVGFIDVDEFFYFPIFSPHYRHRPYNFQTLLANFSLKASIGEIRTACHSFGPSGLSKPPSKGVTVAYTCRLQSPERHKSIIRPEALDVTLLNVVHHFRLKKGFKYVNLRQSTGVINHYKYQVWEVFRSKFLRRVATYVADWKENQNEGSKDRAPGLGTEAIEPANWPLQFCEVWDTGLRDFVVANLADVSSGLFPWEHKMSL